MVIISDSTKANWKKVLNKGFSNSLNKRANKTLSCKHILPSGFIDKEFLDFCLSLYREKGYSIENILYTLALLLTKGIKNKYIGKILNDFGYNLNYIKELENYDKINFAYDILGTVYQYLLSEGERNKNGLYYTPVNIIKKQIFGYNLEYKKILDPACGSGSYLLSLNVSDPNLLYGFDIDKIAVFIAKINLILKYKDKEFNPNIFHLDFINDDVSKYAKFDFIFSNPPWGSKIVKFNKPSGYKVKSGESFSYFLEKGLKILNKGGILSYVLPVSILNVALHSDIREILLNYKIEKIYNFGKCFNGVFTDVISLNVKNESKLSYDVLIDEKKLNIDNFFDKKTGIFNINSSIGDNNLIKRIDNLENVIYLSDKNSIFGLGIVTGNNKEYILKQKDENTVKIYRGKNIEKYFINESNEYLKFIPDKFQQITDIWKYKYAPKLLYRFISKDLKFAYDSEGVFTLNSANFIIPKLDYNIKVILAFFNSKIYNEYFQLKFNSIKVLKSHIQKLPLLIEYSNNKTIISMVDNVLSGNKKYIDILDNHIYKIITK